MAKKETVKKEIVKKDELREEKMKALENALTQLNKTYGKGSVMKFSDKVADTNLQVISTGCLDLDMALGVGGLPRGRVVEIYGPESSGKTTVAVRLAKYLADKRRNVILLLCDMTAPMLPCICPAADLECERSLGSVLAAAHVSENLVKNNLVTHKRLGYLTMLGMLKGENEYTYPPYNEVQARELIDCLREIAPYVVIDCGSSSPLWR